MGRSANQLQIVLRLLAQYDGSMPLYHFLKNYFRINRSAGSTDRRLIRDALYSYCRVANALPEFSETAKVYVGLSMCSKWNEQLREYIGSVLEKSIYDKCRDTIAALHAGGAAAKRLFPVVEHVSTKHDIEAFCAAHLSQPKVFLRVNYGCMERVIQELHAIGIPATQQGNQCIEVMNGVDVTVGKAYELGMYEVMDMGSQRIVEHVVLPDRGICWDVCCGAGGKTLALADRAKWLKKDISFHCTDIRSSILQNYAKRAKKSQHGNITMNVYDATVPMPTKIKYELILADVPCTGSGTWGRTPEQLKYFDNDNITKYAARQYGILHNVWQNLKEGGILYYCTCSVFAEENEMVIEKLLQSTGKLEAEYVWRGYEHGSDSMYMAAIRKE